MMFDIFSGYDAKDAVWIDAVDGLAAAADRMNQLAQKQPGPYFVSCTNRVLVSTDTSEPDGNCETTTLAHHNTANYNDDAK